MATLSADTAADVERMWIEAMRSKGPLWRLQRLLELTRFCRSNLLTGLRRRFPDAGPRQLAESFVEHTYGAEHARQLPQGGEVGMGAADDLWRALIPVADFFESLGVDFHIGGSVASSFVGVARATQDVDVVADLKPAHGFLLVTALEKQYAMPSERIADAIRQRGSFNLIHLETLYKIDVFVMPETAFDREVMRRRVASSVPELGRAFDICSAEDIVLQKLRWYDRGGRVSDRQWNDILGVLKLQGSDLEDEYLRRWAAELGLGDLLREAQAEAGAV